LADRALAAPPSFAQIRKTELLNSIHHHATLLTYDAQLDAARTDIALAEAEKHPDWSVGLVYAKRGPEFSDMVSVEFRIGLPLFARDRQNPQIAAKRAALRKLESEREVELRMHTAEITQMVAEWETLVARTNSFDTELLPLAKERVTLATTALQANRGDTKAALDAQLAYVELQLQALELKGELGKVWVSLEYLQEQRSGT
jgi:outer membrane protein, heavy metal efflux system